MTIIAVIAEYNPFHNGHARQIQILREQFGSNATIVAVMSGSFVQRGEPALFDKWSRAAWAVRAGADCVFELPCAFALCSAEDFAAAGVRLAARLGCTHLSCGIEAGTAADIESLATASMQADVRQALHATRRDGTTYGTALTEAIRRQCPQQADLLHYPNTLLAIEYAKALSRYAPEIELVPVIRTGSHDQDGLTGSYSSAYALRQAILAGAEEVGHIAASLPSGQYSALCQLLHRGAYVDYQRYHDMIVYEGRRLSPDSLSSLAAFSEGLENRWHDLIGPAATWDEGLARLKTRRYSRSRLCRMGAYTVLHIQQDMLDRWRQTGPAYARLLALNSQSGSWLRQAQQEQFPIITKISQSIAALPPPAQAMLKLDILATDIQYLCFHGERCRQGRQDYYHSPVIF